MALKNSGIGFRAYVLGLVATVASVFAPSMTGRADVSEPDTKTPTAGLITAPVVRISLNSGQQDAGTLTHAQVFDVAALMQQGVKPTATHPASVKKPVVKAHHRHAHKTPPAKLASTVVASPAAKPAAMFAAPPANSGVKVIKADNGDIIAVDNGRSAPAAFLAQAAAAFNAARGFTAPAPRHVQSRVAVVPAAPANNAAAATLHAPYRDVYVAATPASRINSKYVVPLGVAAVQEPAPVIADNKANTVRLASLQTLPSQLPASIVALATDAAGTNVNLDMPPADMTAPANISAEAGVLTPSMLALPTIVTIFYGDHSCNMAGCTDRRGQREYYGINVQNPFGLENYYGGVQAVMITPQQWRGEAASQWKDTGEAWLEFGKQFKRDWGTLTFGGRIGGINGPIFSALTDVNTWEHSLMGQSANAIRKESPSSGFVPLVGGFESAVAKMAGTNVWGYDIGLNIAQYANIGNGLTSIGGGPVLSIGDASVMPFPGGPVLRQKGLSLTAGVLADLVTIDAAVPHVNPYQAHAFVDLSVPVWKGILSAEWSQPLLPETRNGVSGHNMSEFKVKFSIAF